MHSADTVVETTQIAAAEGLLDEVILIMFSIYGCTAGCTF